MGILASIESGRRLRVRLYSEDASGLRLVAVLVSVPGATHEAIAALADIFLEGEVVVSEGIRAHRPRRDRP